MRNDCFICERYPEHVCDPPVCMCFAIDCKCKYCPRITTRVDELIRREPENSEYVHTDKPANEYGAINRTCDCVMMDPDHPYHLTKGNRND